MNIDEKLNSVIERLTKAVDVCYEAPEVDEQGYAYATGYSRSIMGDSIEELTEILKELRK